MIKYDNDNIFAKIIATEIPCARVFEDDSFLVFMDVMPMSKGHCLVIPKAPSRNLLDADPSNLPSLIQLVQKIAKATKKAMNADGIIIQQFNEESAGQTVFHLHFHIIPTYQGKKINRHAEKMSDFAELANLAMQISEQL